MPSDPETVLQALRPWDVIFPFDEDAFPATFKMWVCVSKVHRRFLRISTLQYTDSCVPITMAQHPFLTHDSYMGVGGDLIELADDDLVERLTRQRHIDRQGIIGCIHLDVRPTICAALQQSRLLSKTDKRIISSELGCG